jgi:hypothetical protein
MFRKTMVRGEHRQLNSIREMEFFKDARQVVFHRVLANLKPRGDIFVDLAFSNSEGDIEFAAGKSQYF